MNLEAFLAELESLDALLAGEAENFSTLEAMLAQRAALIQQAAGAIDELRKASPRGADALRRSELAGISLMRQLLLAKHILSREMAQLKREQKLWESLTSVGQGKAQQVDLQG